MLYPSTQAAKSFSLPSDRFTQPIEAQTPSLQKHAGALSFRIHCAGQRPTVHEMMAIADCEEEWNDYLRLTAPFESKVATGSLEGCLLLKRPEDGWYAMALVHSSLQARKLGVSIAFGITPLISDKNQGMAFENQLRRSGAQTNHHEGELLASHALNAMESNPGIAFLSSDPELQDEFALHTAMLNALCASTTLAAAEAMRLRLLGMRQSEIASLLGISQVAVHKRLRTASVALWLAVSQRFQAVIAHTMDPNSF